MRSAVPAPISDVIVEPLSVRLVAVRVATELSPGETLPPPTVTVEL